jgi:hypothetical protein
MVNLRLDDPSQAHLLAPVIADLHLLKHHWRQK